MDHFSLAYSINQSSINQSMNCYDAAITMPRASVDSTPKPIPIRVRSSQNGQTPDRLIGEQSKGDRPSQTGAF